LGAWATMSRRRRTILMRRVAYGVAIVATVLVGRQVNWADLTDSMFRPSLMAEQFPKIVTIAAKNTLIFTFFGFVGGLVIGLIVAIMRISQATPFRIVGSVFVDVIRGIPLLVWILIIGFGIPIATGARIPGSYGAGSVALAIVAGGYMAETIRAGIEAVPRGQMEAARSVGMTYSRAMWTIILPQAFRIIIPPLTNELVLLIKDTSLVSVLGVTIGTMELTKFGRAASASAFNATPLITAALVYLIITLPMIRVVAVLEKRAAQSR